MFRPKLVLLVTDVLSELSLGFRFCLAVLQKHGVLYTSAIPEVSWYKPLYNTINHLLAQSLMFLNIDI